MRDLIIRIREIEIKSNKEISDYTRLMKRFRAIVESQEYRSKFTEIVQRADKLRLLSDRLRDYSKNHCDTLSRIAEDLRDNERALIPENQPDVCTPFVLKGEESNDL